MYDTLQDTRFERTERVRSLTKAVYSQLREDIMKARLRPGEKLRVGELCERYGYSSTPVREALMLLAAENFVRSEEMRGFSLPEQVLRSSSS